MGARLKLSLYILLGVLSLVLFVYVYFGNSTTGDDVDRNGVTIDQVTDVKWHGKTQHIEVAQILRLDKQDANKDNVQSSSNQNPSHKPHHSEAPATHKLSEHIISTSARRKPDTTSVSRNNITVSTTPPLEKRVTTEIVKEKEFNGEPGPFDKLLLNDSVPVFFGITPTYKRITQKVDLTSLCQTLMNVVQLVWIVIEDSDKKSVMVEQLLNRCSKVQSVYLNVKTNKAIWKTAKGVDQRNEGLNWIRTTCKSLKERRGKSCSGVVYFMDDDNKYDLRLFDELRKTEKVSVVPVGFAGGLSYEGPTCVDGKVKEWHVGFAKNRKFPVDMAAFAFHVKDILDNPGVKMGYDKNGKRMAAGYLESGFVEQVAKDQKDLECRGTRSEIYVWHTKTKGPDLSRDKDEKKTAIGDMSV